MPNNVKKNLLLLSDLRFDENKNKAAISYKKYPGRFHGSLFEFIKNSDRFSGSIFE